MNIPSDKLQQIRALLYVKQPRYFFDIENDEQLARVVNELLDILDIAVIDYACWRIGINPRLLEG